MPKVNAFGAVEGNMIDRFAFLLLASEGFEGKQQRGEYMASLTGNI
jgi:hypothetical protein